MYCDFAVTVRHTGDLPAWTQALAAEIEHVGDEGLFELAPELTSVYVGGGTPSLLGPGAMSGLAEVLGRDRLGTPELEWTAEANPESLTNEVARGWREAGVNRLSLGAQTFHEPALRWMGRLHGAEGAVSAVRAARAAGIDNLSVDLIFGLPSGVGRSWDDDLDRTLALDVPHVSLYGLTIEAGTPLGKAVREGREPPVDEELYREEFLRAAEVLCSAGYDHYEVSNFARPGAESRHNLVYWEGRPYLGLGNGAHSYAHPVRRWNVRSWERYSAVTSDGDSPEDGREVIDDEAWSLERTWLGLRTREGIAVPAPGTRARAVTDRWERAGLSATGGERLHLTTEGWLVLDQLVIELDGADAHREGRGGRSGRVGGRTSPVDAG